MEDGKLGKYTISGILGKGAMGTVYDARDPVIDRRVAIKTLPLPDASDSEAQEELARFRREAQAAGRLTHPNIVGVFDYGETDKLAYIVMEFVGGPSLKGLLEKSERFPPAETVRIMEALLAGLQFSHERGVVHRDIKPANVMLTLDGQVKIADFGIARIESSSMTQAGTIMGTPAYMSPEQFMGQTVDARTDIYSSGVLLYQMLTGERPFEGSMTAIMHKALNTTPPLPSELSVTAPANLDAVVAKAMAKRPEQRYASAQEFAQALRAAFEGQASAATPPPMEAPLDSDATMIAPSHGGTVGPRAQAGAAPSRPTTPPPMPVPAGGTTRGRLPLILGGAAVLLAAAGGGAYYLLRDTTPPQVTAAIPAPPPPGPAPAVVVPPAVPPVATPAVPPIASPPVATPPPVTPPVASPPVVAPPIVAPPVATPPVATPPVATPPVATPPVATPPAATPAVPPPPAPTPAAPPPAAVTTPPPQQQQQALVPSPPAPPPSPATLCNAIAAAVESVRCSQVDGNVSDQGRVTLSGLSSRPTDAMLRRLVGEAVGTAPLTWGVAAFDGPFCKALDVVRPVTRRFCATGTHVGLTLKSGTARLRENEHMVARVTLPDFPAYLYVSYFAGDGSFQALYPNPQAQRLEIQTPDGRKQRVPASETESRQFPAGATVSFGDPEGSGLRPDEVGWLVGPPFGTDAIMVVASASPLFPQKRAVDEPADTYLRDLQTAIELAMRRGVRVQARALLVETAPR